MRHQDNSRGYVLVHRDWYEIPDEPDPLRRNAIISTLNPKAFVPAEGAQIVKRGFEVLAPSDEVPFSFTICECHPVGGHPFDTLEDACDFLEGQGVKNPKVGFNPVR